MKNTFRILGIIVLAAVIGFSFVSCKEDEETKISVANTSGRLTITGLGAGNNGKYVIAIGTGLVAADNVSGVEGNPTWTGTLISGVSATLKVWQSLSTSSLGNYSGSHTGQDFVVAIYNTQAITASSVTAAEGVCENVNFTGGVGTGAFVATP